MRALVMVALLCGCVREVAPLVDGDAPTSIRVTVPVEARGTERDPLPFSLEPIAVPVALEVLGPEGELLSDWSGHLELRVDPGELVDLEGAEVPPQLVVEGGRAETVAYARAAFGAARVWAEDVGYEPSDPRTAACANDLDDDGDGLVDALDPGCRYVNDGSEEEGSHAAGVSEILYFASPGLADVQGTTGSSPLDGRRVTLDRGRMIVTRVTTDGFTVSEIDEEGAVIPFASLFVFNFGPPTRLRTCDRITRLSGTMGEFFGFTELNFPAWTSEPWCPEGQTCQRLGHDVDGIACPVPEAVTLDRDVLGTSGMEAYESALVRVVSARIPQRFDPALSPQGSNCDLDGSGDVNIDAATEEGACLAQCNTDPDCTEWNQYVEFGQYEVLVSGRVLTVLSRDSVPRFDPLAYRGETMSQLRGTLRQFAPLGLERGYILEPRCEADITISGEPEPTVSACVTPRTGGPVDEI